MVAELVHCIMQKKLCEEAILFPHCTMHTREYWASINTQRKSKKNEERWRVVQASSRLRIVNLWTSRVYEVKKSFHAPLKKRKEKEKCRPLKNRKRKLGALQDIRHSANMPAGTQNFSNNRDHCYSTRLHRKGSGKDLHSFRTTGTS